MISIEGISRTEQALVGAVLQQNAIIDTLTVSAADMTTFHARVVLEACAKVRAAGGAFDAVSIHDHLGTASKTVAFDYLTGALMLGSPGFVANYVEQIKAFRRRSAVAIALDDARRALDDDGPELAVSALYERLTQIELGGGRSAVSIAEAVTELSADIAANMGKPRGFPTGVHGLMHATGGFRPGVVSVIAARPAMGKSSFGLAIAKANAQAGNGVHVFTLEDSRDMYAARYVAGAAEIRTDDLYAGRVNRGQQDRLELLRRRLAVGLPWLIDESNPEQPEELVRRVRASAAANNTKIVIVDYLQIVASSVEARSEHEAISKCMHVFQQAAKRDNLAYIVMCQLNRNLESRDDKRPQLSDLRASGSIEERAKFVIGLYRGAYYSDEPIEGIDYRAGATPPSHEEFQSTIKLCVLKNSTGPDGFEVNGTWRGEFCEIT